MTPHIQAKKEDVAPIVLMPGDPLRAKWIAENFLTDIKLINSVRNMFGYTGMYKGKKITVMGSGMGIGSIGIYSWELFAPSYYDVKTIFRIGSCGSYTKEIGIGQVIVSNSAFVDGNYGKHIGLKDAGNVAFADDGLVLAAEAAAKRLNMQYKKERTHTTDVFYDCRPLADIVNVTGAKIVEMESYALLSNAKFHGKAALTLLTVSDVIGTGDSMTSAERESSLKNMVNLALETAIAVYPS